MRVVVADDAVLLREGLARLLAEAGFEIAGLAADAEELLSLVEQTRPEVAIVDIRMPPTHTDEGLQAARLIRERWPEVGILVLSQHVRASYALELLAQGSAGIGYLLKERVSDLGELAASVERVGQGGSVLDPLVVEQLVGRPRHGHDPLGRLTERERRGARVDGRGALEQGDRRAARRDRAHDREARQAHLRHAATAALAGRPPARAGRRLVSERAVAPLLPAGRTSKESGCPAVPGGPRPAGSRT